MSALPTALVISDFPIVGRTVGAVFGEHYHVSALSWQSFAAGPNSDAALVIVDVTTMDTDIVLSILTTVISSARVVVCSLHENEVHVYRLEDGRCKAESSLPSLLAIAA